MALSEVGERLITRRPAGRRRELRRVVAEVREVVAGRFGVLHLRGPRAIGKSALVELLRDEVCDEADVLVATCTGSEDLAAARNLLGADLVDALPAGRDEHARSYALNDLTFSVANLNTVDVTAAPTVLFYPLTLSPGTPIDGVVFDPITFDANTVGLFNADVSALGISFPLDANGDGGVWACMMFDDDNGTTGITQAQTDNLGVGLCDPPTAGSSPDNLYISDAPVVPRLRPGVEVRPGHPRRFEDVPADVVVVGLTAHRFDDRAEQDEAVVRVLEARARLESRRT